MTPSKADFRGEGRWVQLIAGIVCMVMIANLQYGWTLFIHPMREKFGWDRSAIQVAFTIFILVESWLIPVEGWLVDRFGPRRAAMAGAVLIALGWTANGLAQSLSMLYVGAVLGGLGAGCIFGTCTGNAIRWFPDRRGLAVGLTAAGYGMGSAFTVVPMQYLIQTEGYQATFLLFGIGQGVVVLVAALLLKAPPYRPVFMTSAPSWSTRQVIRTPIFWVMYVTFVLVAAGGLTFTAQLAPMAHDFKVATIPVELAGITLPALTFAIALDRVTNGITRPLCGWVSDHIGREQTMCVVFLLEAAGVWALARWGSDPLMFVVLGGVVFFAWGEIASLFPALCTDLFGDRYAAANIGAIYTAKGTASLLVPLASLLADATGGWHDVLMIVMAMNLVAAVFAIAVIRPMRLARTNVLPNEMPGAA
ncbi:MFS transporter, OFA family, oxalate/formate antiporter [Enhydrobacter aerosaccus]|uniref:MFS transporter, OFA family, oxalate/formate antiporter n=1 Tax=Enhydrobacter aerosaccus TaxID=225324 RepID=A0A1T4MVF4_9HYPH|nr:oxalate/formate MFS antiporter [Enhydrobacter aerosaccus]SJZ70982.1 MFS transporter, OFA family, oxalate/formate antiporter [Enhydrobacter aerosaccus]